MPSASTLSSGLPFCSIDLQLRHRLRKRTFAVNRPDGQKKAYIRLGSNVDALDVANKVRCYKKKTPFRDGSKLISMEFLQIGFI